MAIIVSLVLNLFLDYFFIFVCHTGVEGAAIATVIAQFVSAFICLGKLRKLEFVKLKRSDFRNTLETYICLLSNGIPMAFMNSITAIGCMVVQYFINGMGVLYTTAYSACGKYINLFMTPACSAGHAMSAFTSQNFGAKKYDRIKKGLRVCLGIAFASYVILGSVMVFFGRQMAEVLLTGEDAIALLMNILGFRAAAVAEVTAWTSALLLNAVAFYRFLNRKVNEQNNNEIVKTNLILGGEKHVRFSMLRGSGA